MEEEVIEFLPTPRHCFVPQCFNNSNKQRDMVFVPVKDSLKADWCRLLNRNCPNRRLYCCEVHLDLEKDIENYEKWRTQGGYPIMSRNASLKRIPTQLLTTVNVQQRQKRRMPCLLGSTDNNILSSSSTSTVTPDLQGTSLKCDKIIQVAPVMHDKGTLKRAKKEKRTIIETIKEESIAPAVSGSSYECERTETSSSAKIPRMCTGRNHMLEIIQNNPLMYIGIPKQYLWVIDEIVKHYKRKTNMLNIIITLFKIRQGDTLVRISHQFQMSLTRLHKIFYETTRLLSSYFQNFITCPSTLSIKDNLPYTFKTNYSNVIMILDCFEIGIEKPSNPVRQAQTWSSYKSCNTTKYLVGAAPSGLITFISKGYGGRITDKGITIESGLIDYLPINSVIMADRGFKEIESLLSVKNIKLLRPPSVYANTKPTKQEVKESKVIASLRIHIERIIRRLREFRILKPHSLINHKHVPYFRGRREKVDMSKMSTLQGSHFKV